MNDLEKWILEWMADFKKKHDRIPKRLPGAYQNYKLVDADRTANFLDLIYRQGRKCFDVQIWYKVDVPQMVVDWYVDKVRYWEIED